MRAIRVGRQPLEPTGAAVNDDDQLLETGRLAELGLQASTLVHELRQPVFAVKAIAQLALDDSEANDSERLEELLAQVGVLETLIHRYGDASRKPTGIQRNFIEHPQKSDENGRS